MNAKVHKLISVGIIVGLTTTYLFALTGDEILKQVEDTLNAPKDLEATAKVVLANLDGTDKEVRTMKLWSAGKEKSLVKFLSPNAVKGIGLLKLSKDKMYLYLPATRKIRRIQGSMKDEKFQGMDFTYEEISGSDYTKNYSAKLIKETDDSYQLLLTRKPGSDKKYDKALMTVDKKTMLPVKVELFQNGKKVKVLETLEKKKVSKYWIPTRLKVTDLEAKHYTELIMQSVKVDQGLVKKRIFTKRFLKKRI